MFVPSLVCAIEPLFEAGFLDWSYACRRGKGTHAALARARKLARRHPYFLKLDVSSYFDSIDHGVLMRLLARKIDDPGVLWLCRVLMDGAEVPTVACDEGRGLPIGNLTSQFWANVYLDPLDQMVVRRRGIGTYSRYMDDALVLGSSKGWLWELASEIRCFCLESLGLQLKDRVTVVAPVTEGIPWLGFRVFPGTTRLDHHGKYRFIRNLRRSMAQANQGWHEEERAVAGAASLCGHLTQANAMNLRRSVIDRHLTGEHHHVLRAAGQSGTNRVIRGGSFDNTADNLRAANRNDNDPGNRNDNIGARCGSSRAHPRLVSTDASPVYDHP